MRRRVFLIGVGTLVTAPLAAEAQEAARVFRLGILTNVSPTPLGVGTRFIVPPLRELGYVEGQNIIIDFRWSEAPHRLAQLATELVRAKVRRHYGDRAAGHPGREGSNGGDPDRHVDQR